MALILKAMFNVTEIEKIGKNEIIGLEKLLLGIN